MVHTNQKKELARVYQKYKTREIVKKPYYLITEVKKSLKMLVGKYKVIFNKLNIKVELSYTHSTQLHLI